MSNYCGRFAPSPTGPLHFGSLVAALGSYLDARSQNGQWLVRMEDLDPPREMPGAANAILNTLEAFGLEWDGEVLYQSSRLNAYAAVMGRLVADGRVYPCSCSRKQIREIAKIGPEGPIYPGTCRGADMASSPAGLSVRMNTAAANIEFSDRLCGPISESVDQTYGDFVLRRADGLFAYQLAVVIDDAMQSITDVVRGNDLLSSTSRQIWLQRCLDLDTPRYLHLPLAVGSNGSKLSKQTGALALEDERPQLALFQALKFLGQDPIPELRDATVSELLRWATSHWRVAALPRQRTIWFNPDPVQ